MMCSGVKVIERWRIRGRDGFEEWWVRGMVGSRDGGLEGLWIREVIDMRGDSLEGWWVSDYGFEG